MILIHFKSELKTTVNDKFNGNMMDGFCCSEHNKLPLPKATHKCVQDFLSNVFL